MAWTIRVSDKAVRELRKLDRQVARRIRDELAEIAGLDDPRSRGKELAGNLAGLWLYHVGDYRAICDIEDEVLVVGVAHRSEVYRRR